MDGDLGPYDSIEVRMLAADTVILLDYSLARCAWRAVRRPRERADFWLSLLRYRSQSRPIVLQPLADRAVDANVHVIGNPGALARFVADIAGKHRPGQPPLS
jgi:hypothetical protein